jgi:RHS repeat-associated protein
MLIMPFSSVQAHHWVDIEFGDVLGVDRHVMKLYVDGVLVKTAPTDPPLTTYSASWTVPSNHKFFICYDDNPPLGSQDYQLHVTDGDLGQCIKGGHTEIEGDFYQSGQNPPQNSPVNKEMTLTIKSAPPDGIPPPPICQLFLRSSGAANNVNDQGAGPGPVSGPRGTGSGSAGNASDTGSNGGAQNSSGNSAPSHTGEPINLLNGDNLISEHDFTIPCPGIPLTFTRKYHSAADANHATLGPRWFHTYDWRISKSSCVISNTGESYLHTNLWMTLQTGQGDQYFFQGPSNGMFTSWNTANWKLNGDETNGYKVTMPAGYVYAFDTNGVLNCISNEWGNCLTMSYSNNYPTNVLTRVQHSNGQQLNFGYDNTTNDLVLVTTPSTNLYMSFAYDASETFLTNKMTNATLHTSSGNFVTTYGYDTNTYDCNTNPILFRNTIITQRVNRLGDVFSYGYITNTDYGICTNLVVDTDYYNHTLYLPDNETGRTVLTYFKTGASNHICECYFDSTNMLMQQIGGSHTATGMTTRGQFYLYDANRNITNTTTYDTSVGQSNTTLALYDNWHNATNKAYAFCATPTNWWSYAWDTNFMVLSLATDPEGHKVGYDYTNGYVSRIKKYYDVNNFYSTAIAYMTNGLLSSITNANSHSASFYYNSYGYMTSVVPQLGPVVAFGVNQLGFTTNVTLPGDSGPRTISLDRNELGWVNKVTYPNSQYATLSRDAYGNVTNYVDIAGRTSRFTWLPGGILSSVSCQLGATYLTTSLTRDNQMNTLKITDAKGRSVETYVLDVQDRATSVTNLENQTMSVNYGLGNFIKSITRFDQTVVTNTFDSNGWITKRVFPGITNNFTYLKNGLMRTATNTTCLVSNTWDFANRLTNSRVIIAGSAVTSTVSYTYFPAGQMSNVVSKAGTNTYTLDAAERLSTLTARRSQIASPLTFNYSFNTNNGLVSAVTSTNSGLNVSYNFDIMDRITGITWKNAASNVVKSFAYQYNNASMITNILLEDGSSLAYSYDDLDRLTSETTVTRPGWQGSTTSTVSYAYDEVGNRLAKTNGGTTVSYQYSNGCNRLTSWSATSANGFTNAVKLTVSGNASENIAINPWLGQLWVSNKVAVTPSVSGTNFMAASLPMGIGTQNVVAAISDLAGNVGYATNAVTVYIYTNGAYLYSPAGCVTNIRYLGAGGTQSVGLTWNGQYQLTAVTTNGVAAERNGFDALGRRVWNWDGTTTNYFVYDGQQIIADVNRTGALVRTYVWGPGIDNLLAMTVHTGAVAQTYYAIRDHLGSVQAMVNTNGTIVESYEFDAWGKLLGVFNNNGLPQAQSGIGNRYLWQGREYSGNTGLYFFRSRWYDPITGRWLSNDPIGISGGLNQYVFCSDNPVNKRDPLGLRTDNESSNTTSDPTFSDVAKEAWKAAASSPNAIPYVSKVISDGTAWGKDTWNNMSSFNKSVLIGAGAVGEWAAYDLKGSTVGLQGKMDVGNGFTMSGNVQLGSGTNENKIEVGLSHAW